MVEKFKLKLEGREGSLKPNQLRRTGKIPATLYGPGTPSENVQIDAREFSRLPVGAYSHVVELDSGKGAVPALIRHVHRSHTSFEVLNVEFYRVAADRKITVTIPIKFVGVSPAMTLGGQIVENFSDCEIECFPGDIPDNLTIDMATITELDQGIHFGELKLPHGITILNPAEEVIVRIVPKKAEAETPKETAAAAAPAPAAAAKSE
jgi:large subunit ribosomal protein L25